MEADQNNRATGRAEIVATLRAARRARHRAAREQTKSRRARAAELRRQGQAERAATLEVAEDRRSYSLIRRRRRLAELELRRFWRMIRVRVEPEKRPRFRKTCPAALYSRFEYGTGGVGEARHGGEEREVFLQWIGRGFKSGRDRAGSRRTAARTGRHRPWRPGEPGRMVRYITREEALEEVEQPVFSNVGGDVAEAVGFFRELEKVEAHARADASVYVHVILALPYDVSPEGRVDIVSGIVKPLDDLGLGYVAALHKPDKDGDQRNHHAHIVLSLRPMKRRGDYEWELAPTKTTWLDTPAGLLLLRRHVAREINRALAAAGSATRWTHLSRAARGMASPGNNKRRPGDRHERAAVDADAAIRAQASRRESIERVATVVDLLDTVVSKVADQREQLADFAQASAAHLRRLHARLLDLAAQADRTKRRLAQQRAVALAHLRSHRATVATIVGAACALTERTRAMIEGAAAAPVIAPAPKSSLDRLIEQREKARSLYPTLSAAVEPRVRTFLAALRNVDTPDRLAKLAGEISASPHALAELDRLGDPVRRAYAAALQRPATQQMTNGVTRDRGPGMDRTRA